MSLIKAFGSLTIQSRSFVSARSLHPKKFTSILSNVPTRPRSAWQIYLRENINKYKFPNGKIDMKKATIESGAIWKSMGEAQKKIYQDTYEAEAKAHDESVKKALNSATPKQFKDENDLRKKYKLAPLKDPRHPKKPKNSFLLYIDHLRAINDPAVASKDCTVQISEAAKKYKTLSESELQTYKDKSKDSYDQFNKDLKKYYQDAGLIDQ